MSDWKQKIEADIAEVENNPEGARYVLVSMYRLQALLDVAVAADSVIVPEYIYHPKGNMFVLKTALDKLREMNNDN